MALQIFGGGASASSLAGTFATRPRLVSDLVEPYVIPHRGYNDGALEDTMQGFRVAFAQGWSVMELGDVQVLADGALAVMHDTTLDRTTTVTGNVADQTSASWAQVKVSGSKFLTGVPDVAAPFWSEVMGELGGKVVGVVEAKVSAATAKMITYLQAAGLTKSVIFNSFALGDCQAARSAGIAASFNGTAAQAATNQAALLAGGISASITDVDTVSDAAITSLISAGVKVIMGPMSRQWQYDRFTALGVAGMYSDNPLYFAKRTSDYRRTTVTWTKTGMWGHGHLAASNGGGGGETVRGKFVGSAGAYRWQPQTDAFNLIGEICPIVNKAATYTITVPITLDTAGSDTNRWLGVYFAAPTDILTVAAGGATDNGYLALLRQSGTANLYRVVNGAATQIGTFASTALTTGSTATLALTVTPTTVTLARTDTANTTGPIADATTRGGYVHMGKNATSTGGLWSAGAVTVS